MMLFKVTLLYVYCVIYVGFSGAGIPAAGLAGPGVVPFALRHPGVAAVPLAGHSMSPLSNSALMTADGHVISPQALQLVLSLFSFTF